ncbi:MAG: ATPase [Planctomycetes bacterium]|nr:ATPase [Planctomycetota bacterium]
MHVLFVEPAFPANQREFVRALTQVGAAVTGIGESPASALPEDVRRQLTHYEQVRSVVDGGALYDAVRRCQQRGWVDRLECTVEAHVEPTAAVREACDIPGISKQTAFLCRDKPAMKAALREAGIPCAQTIGTGDFAEAKEFAASVGYPVCVKPRDAAGASGTHRCNDEEELVRALEVSGVGRGAQVGIEEWIEGHEGFYDTICADGEILHDFACHYFPGVLEAMRTRWISPQIVLTNRLDSAPDYAEVRELGKRVIDTLGITTAATHMEWFFGPKGLKFSEIGCRPPGVRVWDFYGKGNDIDCYLEWAKAIVHGKTDVKCSRRLAAGMIALRPDRDGRIQGYSGREILDRYEDCLIDAHFPAPGTPTQPVENGYLANAWVRMAHPDFDRLQQILGEVGETVRVHAG